MELRASKLITARREKDPPDCNFHKTQNENKTRLPGRSPLQLHFKLVTSREKCQLLGKRILIAFGILNIAFEILPFRFLSTLLLSLAATSLLLLTPPNLLSPCLSRLNYSQNNLVLTGELGKQDKVVEITPYGLVCAQGYCCCFLKQKGHRWGLF